LGDAAFESKTNVRFMDSFMNVKKDKKRLLLG